jgi:opacity protein-like surface antigen
MKNLLLLPTILASLVAAAIVQAPTAALAGGIGNNYIAPSVTFSSGTAFGVDGKFGIADNISLRPYVFFPSAGIQVGSSVTYDWDLRQASLPITPFIGLGALFQTGNESRSTVYAQVGADLNISENIALLGAVAFPFSNNFVTGVTLGAGLRF